MLALNARSYQFNLIAVQGVAAVIELLEQLDKWIDVIPPLPTPQRFGNLSFRTWGKNLEEVRTCLLAYFDVCTHHG
jgi:Phosphotyrosyl phosphate activator (PTPA) protein